MKYEYIGVSSLTNDLWDKNKENLGEKDKELWLEIEGVLNDVLEELRAGDKIRTYYTENEKTHLWLMEDNLKSMAQNYNLVSRAVLDEIGRKTETGKKHEEAFAELGFDMEKIYKLTVQMVVLTTIMHTEQAKVYFLFHLKNISNYKACNFNSIMRRNAPNTWDQLKPYVDNDFRNSLAHGTWAISENKIILFKDSRLVPYERLDLAGLIIKSKSQNILYSCVINSIKQKFKDYYFKRYF